MKWHNLSTWNSYCGSKYVLTSWWGRPCLQFDGNLQPTIDYRRSSSHSPECQFPLNQIYLVVTDVEILLLLDTYKIFFEVMASCCLQGNIEANQSSVSWSVSENWIYFKAFNSYFSRASSLVSPSAFSVKCCHLRCRDCNNNSDCSDPRWPNTKTKVRIVKEFVKQYNLLSDLLLATCFTSREVVQNKLKHLARQLMNTRMRKKMLSASTINAADDWRQVQSPEKRQIVN